MQRNITLFISEYHKEITYIDSTKLCDFIRNSFVAILTNLELMNKAMLTFLSSSTIFVKLLPIGVVAVFSWYDDGSYDPFNSRSLAGLLGSPLICFSKLSFLTDSSIHILLNAFIFLMQSAYFEQTTHLMRLTFPSEISKTSTLHFKVSCHFFTVFNFALILLDKSNW